MPKLSSPQGSPEQGKTPGRISLRNVVNKVRTRDSEPKPDAMNQDASGSTASTSAPKFTTNPNFVVPPATKSYPTTFSLFDDDTIEEIQADPSPSPSPRQNDSSSPDQSPDDDPALWQREFMANLQKEAINKVKLVAGGYAMKNKTVRKIYSAKGIWEVICGVGNFFRKGKSDNEVFEEAQNPSLRELRDAYVGFAGLCALAISFIYNHITWTPLVKVSKWTGIKWLSTSLFLPVVNFINAYFTPVGEKIAKEIVLIKFGNGTVYVQIGKGLWILIVAAVKVAIYAIIIMFLFLLIQRIFEYTEGLREDVRARKYSRQLPPPPDTFYFPRRDEDL